MAGATGEFDNVSIRDVFAQPRGYPCEILLDFGRAVGVVAQGGSLAVVLDERTLVHWLRRRQLAKHVARVFQVHAGILILGIDLESSEKQGFGFAISLYQK